MEEEKKMLIDKGLSLRSEEVNEIMGKVPHRVFRVGTVTISCIVALLVAIGYLLQVPGYMEVSYVVSGNTLPVGIASKDAGIVMFRYDQPHPVETGDTVATIMKGNERVYSVSPISGMIENNFLYTTGDYIASGDTLARVIPNASPRHKLILKIPLNMKSKVKNGMRIKFATEGETAENAVGYIKKVSVIPDGTNCYHAIVEMPASSIQHLPASGKAKLQYKTESVFEKILTKE